MSTDFYQTARFLDEIKNIQHPHEEEIHRVVQLITEEKYARYFFLNLENPIWVPPLHKNNIFSNPPGPIEIQKGSFQLPNWSAGEYLAKMADRYEEIVVNVAKQIKTENWRVQEILIDAMLKIAPPKAAELVPIVDVWMSGRFSNMLPHKLLQLANHFLENGIAIAAIKILEYVMTPVGFSGQIDNTLYRAPIKFRPDHYWANEYYLDQFTKLIRENPIDVNSVFERQLTKAIELVKGVSPEDAEIQIGYYWRYDIPDRISERSDADAIDILIDGVRDSLAEVCKQSESKGKEFLTRYLDSEHIIFNRVAMFVLRKYGEKYPELVNSVLTRHECLENAEYTKEYMGLLRDQFGAASDVTRAMVITWILSGPDDVDSRTKWWVDNREVTDQDRQNTQEYWRLRHLEIVRSYLPSDTLQYLDHLVDKHGKPDIEERPSIVTTSWGGAPSPLSKEDISKLSFVELKQFLLSYSPEDLFLNPRESLGRTLGQVVEEDPNHYYELSSLLIDPSIRFIYIYNYLSGMRESIRNKNGRISDQVLDLCYYVVNQTDDPFKVTSSEYEPGLRAAQMEVANLLVSGLNTADPYITKEQLALIRKSLIILLHHPDPDNQTEKVSSFNAYTHSLNCVRGMATHGIIQYSLYRIRQIESEIGTKMTAGMLEPEVQKALEEKLDLSVEPSLAVHSVFGAYFPQLHFLSRNWVEQNIDRIFPDNENKTDYWKAAWDGYIFRADVFHDVFSLLIPQYQRGLRALVNPSEDAKTFGGNPVERLAQHIMFAYIANLTDFSDENQLIDLFFQFAPDQLRAQGIAWLGDVLKNHQPSHEDPLWKKFEMLWLNRLDFAETQDSMLNSQEISEYMRWLKYCPLELGDLFPVLETTIKYLHDGYDVKLMNEFAAANCEKYPLEAVKLLSKSILSAQEYWWQPKDEDEEKILRIAMVSGNADARQIAIDVINLRGEQGDFQWKSLLDLPPSINSG